MQHTRIIGRKTLDGSAPELIAKYAPAETVKLINDFGGHTLHDELEEHSKLNGTIYQRTPDTFDIETELAQCISEEINHRIVYSLLNEHKCGSI